MYNDPSVNVMDRPFMNVVHFVETMEFAKKASFARPPILSLIKPGDIAKEFQ